MPTKFEIDDGFIAEQNEKARSWVEEDYDALAKKLNRRGVGIEDLVERARSISVAVPSWGVGTGGTRFARFPGEGEPRGIYEKLEDCGTIFKLVRSTPGVSLHIPWDKPDEAAQLRAFATERGMSVVAPADGTVRFSGPFRDYDGVLILDHGGGWMSLIVNVASPLKPGDKVRLGDPLGRALGPIEVELSHNGQRFSPALIAGSSQTLSKAMKGG